MFISFAVPPIRCNIKAEDSIKKMSMMVDMLEEHNIE